MLKRYSLNKGELDNYLNINEQNPEINVIPYKN